MREKFLLRDDVIYLNHGSFGACPREVFTVYQRWQRELEAEPAEFMRRRKDLLRDARSVLADFVGADPDDLVFVTNATTGLNAVARSVPLVPGDEVLTTDQEYGALDRTWRFVCERRGATLVRAPKGAAFLHARREVQPLLEPLVVSWGWQAEKPGPSRFLDEHEWQGTRDPAAALSVPAAIEFLAAHNWDAVRRACRDLLRTARSAIAARVSLPPLCPDDATWFVQIASVQLPPCDAEALSRGLFDDLSHRGFSLELERNATAARVDSGL